MKQPRFIKKILLFPAGASGHFLSEFLSSSHPTTSKVQYRMDWQQLLPSATFVVADNTESGRSKLISEIENGDREFIISHRGSISDLRDLTEKIWIRKIFPLTNRFGWLKNVFYKKQTLERVDYTQAPIREQLDGMFMNISDFYTQLISDNDLPEDLVIDFGRLCDIDFLDSLYRELHNKQPSEHKIKFAEDYILLQSIMEDCEDLEVHDIIEKLQPKDVFDLAALIFIYEKNHKTIDSNRLWTIDDIPNSIDGALKFFVDNRRNYKIF